MARIPLIAGNWKMHKTGAEARLFIHDLAKAMPQLRHRVYLAAPFTAIADAVEAADSTRFVIGAQNMHDQVEGAFTGEISARMLKELGAQFVILGHSERRVHFGETNAFINRKLHCALEEGLTPILCIGESLEQRESGMTQRVLVMQLQECLKGCDPEHTAQVVIAYEPIWAIGTGKTATPALAQEVHREIRAFIEHSCGEKAAQEICLLYGGSVTPETISGLMREPDIDGALVGGASLDVAQFAQIIDY